MRDIDLAIRTYLLQALGTEFKCTVGGQPNLSYRDFGEDIHLIPRRDTGLAQFSPRVDTFYITVSESKVDLFHSYIWTSVKHIDTYPVRIEEPGFGDIVDRVREGIYSTVNEYPGWIND